MMKKNNLFIVIFFTSSVLLWSLFKYYEPKSSHIYTGEYVLDTCASDLCGYLKVDYGDYRLTINSDNSYYFNRNIPLLLTTTGKWKLVKFDTNECLELQDTNNKLRKEQFCSNGNNVYSISYPSNSAVEKCQSEMLVFKKIE